MDMVFLSARQLALALGTTTPRVKRAISRLGLDANEDPTGRVKLSQEQVELLRHALGTTPAVPGLSRTEALVLSAQRAGVSPTAAAKAIRALRVIGLVTSERRSLPGVRVREREIIRANLASPRWRSVADALAQVHPAVTFDHRRDQKVPSRLAHLFWNTASTQRDPRRAGGYIARRLLTADDPEGLAWGAESLAAKDWRHAAGARGISPRRRALALNLAAQGRGRG